MTPPQPRLPATYRLVFYDTLDSTNEEAKRLARTASEDGTLVWALEQTAGRGRRGRAWASPPGNLYASLILRPQCPLDRAAQLGFAAALAVGDTLTSTCEQPLDRLFYKWPNDVLLHDRKVAGILLESELGEGEFPKFVVLGVGINLVSSPRETEFPATSIAEQGLGTVSPSSALEEFASHFRAWMERWREEGFAPIRAAWRAREVDPGTPGAHHLARPVHRHRSARRAPTGDRRSAPLHRRWRSLSGHPLMRCHAPRNQRQ